MKVAFGLKAHSGWAALVVLGIRSGNLQVVERRRMELVEDDAARWAKQPYHAAQGLSRSAARQMVERGVRSAHRIAAREIQAAVKRARAAGHEVDSCAVLMADPMPDWSVDEILAVHFRMHKAEGVLFREALAQAAAACGLRFVAISEKSLEQQTETALATPVQRLKKTVATLGKSVGPPWGKDQKEAALAAMIALQERAKAKRPGKRRPTARRSPLPASTRRASATGPREEKRRFPDDILAGLRASKILGLRAGTQPHRFIGIWVVVVEGRVFVRSWSLKQRSWYRTFLEEPRGAVQVAGRQMPVRAVRTRSERLRAAVDRAYLEKYNTPGAIQYARDLGGERSRATTTELVPF